VVRDRVEMARSHGKERHLAHSIGLVAPDGQRNEARSRRSPLSRPPSLVRRAALLVAVLASVGSCESAPEEPAGGKGRPLTKHEPLAWTAPAGWNTERTADSGVYRAKYEIPTAGDAKHPAELLVWTVDTAKELQVARNDLLAAFEGQDVDPKDETLKVGAFDVVLTEVAGRYKFPVGPPMGKKKKHAAHVLKDDWRAIIATVDTHGRGRWVFRMVGPTDTVASARGAFRTMIQDLR